MSDFFNAHYLMDMLDANGKRPETFVVCSRVRGPGKTTGIGTLLIEHFFNTGYKFVLVCRQKNEIGGYAEGILKNSADMYDGWSVKEDKSKNDNYSKIIFYRVNKVVNDKDEEVEETEKVNVGYVVSIRGAYKLKNYSSIFVDSWCMWIDEFLLQEGNYFNDEIRRIKNMHTSLARGEGKAVRYYPIILSANCIDIINPYFLTWGIVGKIQSNTRKYKGDGIVYMRYESKAIAKQHEDSMFNRTWSGNDNENDFSDNSWLVDNNTLVEKPYPVWGTPHDQVNLHDGDTWLKLSVYPKVGMWYISSGMAKTVPTVAIGREPEPGEMLWDAPGQTLRKRLRDKFKNGQLRFKSEIVKRKYLEYI